MLSRLGIDVEDLRKGKRLNPGFLIPSSSFQHAVSFRAGPDGRVASELDGGYHSPAGSSGELSLRWVTWLSGP